MTYRVLVTGSRDWDDAEAIADALAIYGRFDDTVLIHGACPTGADELADAWAAVNGVTVERYPADWSQGRRAGLDRNDQMVALGADVCVAFIKNESRGASYTAAAAEKAGILTVRRTA